MKNINVNEIQEVSGGHPVALGIIGGIAGNYIYDSIGGMDGINSAFSSLGAGLMDAWDNDPVMSRIFPN